MTQHKDHNKFNIVDNEVKAIVDTNGESEVLHIIGIANTGQRDLVGDILTDEALFDVCSQALNHNLHLDHDSSLNGILGPITRAELTELGVEIEADIVNNEYKERIRELLGNGVKLGMSVSGCTTHNAEDPSLITNWDLTEISLTPLPCDQGTMGTVMMKSFTDATLRITENKTEEEALEEKQMAEEVTLDKVIELINEAFNDRKEEFLETIRGDIKNEYDVVLNEIKERMETIESAIASTTTEEVVDEETGELVEEAVDESDSVEEKEADESEAESEEEEEEEEESAEEKNVEDDVDIEKKVHELVQKKIDEIFSEKKAEDLHFKYEEQEQTKTEKQETKKAYTPKELARILSQGGI